MPLHPTPSGSQPPRTLSVFIADDDRQLRGFLRLLLESEPDISVAGEAGTGSETLEALACCCQPPDVLLVDVNMPTAEPSGVLHAIRREYPTVRIIVYSGEDEETGRRRIARDLRGVGYVVKGLPDRLLAALREVGRPEAGPAAQRGA